MAFQMLRGSFFISTSLATFWIPVAQALYTLPLKDNTDASNRSIPLIEKRFPKTEDGRCGVDFGTSCENDECCSSQGWCGKGYLYCSAPACQLEYGPYCDANRRPLGANTDDWPRPHVGDVPYGKAIFHCTQPGTVALTFDDGPWNYTRELLDVLEEYNVKATFFITGRNLGKGAINDPETDWPRLIHRMKADGHQIASHTWSHQRLPTLSRSLLRQQMIYNEIAIADILGFFPTYMRPPYSASNTDVDEWLGELGYHVTYFDLDTEGYLHDSEEEIEVSKNIVDKAFTDKDPTSESYLHIEHDTVYETVATLVAYTIDALYEAGFRAVTVGQCLDDPYENWYRWPDEEYRKRSLEGLGESATKPFNKTWRALNHVNGASANIRPEHNQRRHLSKQPSSGPFKPQPLVKGSRLTVNQALSPPYSLPFSRSIPLRLLPFTDTGRCGPEFGNATCADQKTEKCCSKTGWCGSTEAHCSSDCQETFGICGVN
ncbi:chitin deacetylase [Trichoderma asperellum]|nr:carbohydrate-binding module family 18 [Trichoderma asperelloides]